MSSLYTLSLEQRVFAFLLFVKHDNTSFCDSFQLGKSKLNDNVIFVASCLNEAISHEIDWLDVYEREVRGDMLPGVEGVMGNINDTLVKIRRPYKTLDHSCWFNMRKLKLKSIAKYYGHR